LDDDVLPDMGGMTARLLWAGKNYLFAGSNAGGERAAAAYTLIETALCRARHKAVYAGIRTMPNVTVFPVIHQGIGVRDSA
jgi:hypothetical protein